MVNEREARILGYITAGIYAGQMEQEGYKFYDSADSVVNCKSIQETIDNLKIPYTTDGLVDIEIYRDNIFSALREKFVAITEKVFARKYIQYAIDIYGSRSNLDNEDDDDLWFECPECGEPILYEDYPEAFEFKPHCTCPICEEWI